MAYVDFNNTEIAPGQPNKTDLWIKVQQDFMAQQANLNTLLAALNLFRPMDFAVFGDVSLLVPLNTVMIERVNFNMTLLSAKLFTGAAGSSGTLAADLKYKRGAGSWTSIFSTTPTVAYTAGDFALSTNQVLGFTTLLVGDLLRLDVTGAQTGQTEFHMLVEFQKT